ncbi:hypothetical protein CRG98_024795 [Punica granatum]|uniref:F-box domain-containing protein n=1 Tax=Punica granatum TaxID=22663 RepID=A0A2I0JEV5_PUNGR|nr:hypothetical protein CRG98_024795 [Punica granatum]
MEKGSKGTGKETIGISVGAGRSHIPEDVLIEILKRLPKKSLCRFRCMSTTWLSLISSHLFESSRWAHWQSYLMMLATIPCESDRAEVCNPTTKEHIMLPKLSREPHLHIQRTSLCFDPIKNQHKVLWSLKYSNVDGGVVEHHIFILGASRWRKIKHNDCHERFGEEVCVNGVLYSRAIFYVGSTLTIVLVAFTSMLRSLTYAHFRTSIAVRVEYFDGKIALPSREVLPRHGLFYLMGSLRNGELLAFIWNPNIPDISYSFFFYDAKNDVFWKLAQPPISIPRGLFEIDQVYVSDYVDNPTPLKAW